MPWHKKSIDPTLWAAAGEPAQGILHFKTKNPVLEGKASCAVAPQGILKLGDKLGDEPRGGHVSDGKRRVRQRRPESAAYGTAGTPEEARTRSHVSDGKRCGRPEDFRAIVTAFEVLTDSQRRVEYDRSLNAAGNADGGNRGEAGDLEEEPDVVADELAAQRAVREALIRLTSARKSEQGKILQALRTKVLEEVMEFVRSTQVRSQPLQPGRVELQRSGGSKKPLSLAGIYNDTKGRYAVEMSWHGLSMRTQITCSLAEAIGWHITLTQLKARACERIHQGVSVAVPLTQEELVMGYRASPTMVLSFICRLDEDEAPATPDLALALRIKRRADEVRAMQADPLNRAAGQKIRHLKREVLALTEREAQERQQEESAILLAISNELLVRHRRSENSEWKEEAETAMELCQQLGLESLGLQVSVAKLQHLDHEQKNATRALLVGQHSGGDGSVSPPLPLPLQAAAYRSVHPPGHVPAAVAAAIAAARTAKAVRSGESTPISGEVTPNGSNGGNPPPKKRRAEGTSPSYQLPPDRLRALRSPLLPSSQFGRPDAVLRSLLGFSALLEWFSLRACSRVVRAIADANLARCFNDFVYCAGLFQWRTSATPRPSASAAARFGRFLCSTHFQSLFAYMDLSTAPVATLQDPKVQVALSQMPRLKDVVFPSEGWSKGGRDRFLSCLPPGTSAWGSGR
ncbi:unnamed protein product [Effrenium voratum]|uniref:Uncharacterized protein n=1 Tax=Effrenium voratum TaxID=2562239 RepID=A0AA36N2G7_9DINO|nr:unnamed protein product [Effrenium voratum]